MNLKEIREMVNLMNENDLMEMEVEREGSKIKLKKASSGVVQQVVSQPVAAAPVVQAAVPQVVAPVEEEVSGHQITSPMVGTFYRSPSPDSPPFVEVGQTVEVGQVICIVEAMKLMNELKADVRGKILSIPIENAHPVEFGQTLIIVDPA